MMSTWKTLGVACFFFWLVYSTIYFFANNQELLKKDLEHQLDDARGRVAILKNEIMDVGYETDLLSRFAKENQRLLKALQKVSNKALREARGEKVEDNEEVEDEEVAADIKINDRDKQNRPRAYDATSKAKEVCTTERKEMINNLEAELKDKPGGEKEKWIRAKIGTWEKDKVHQCEKERWEIATRQKEGNWNPGDEFSSEWSCHWNYLNIVLQFPNVLTADRPEEKKRNRQKEFNDCLKHTAQHPVVEKIHLFYNKKEDLEILKEIPDPYKKIVTIKKPGDNEFIHYSQAFEFANTLKGKIVMIQNADVFLDSGFPLLEDFHFRNGTTVFSLSRQEISARGDKLNPNLAPSLKCPTKSEMQEDCRERQGVGSHDAFVFLPPVPQSFISKVDHQQNAWGAENVVVYELTKVGLHAWNPCSLLRIFHNHCSDSRPRYTDLRVNNGGRSGIGPGTNTLLPDGVKDKQFVRWRTMDRYRECLAQQFHKKE